MTDGIWSHIQHPTAVTGTGASLSKAFTSPVKAHSLLVATATTDSTPGIMTFSSTGSPLWGSFTSYKDPTTGQYITIGYCLDAPAGATTITCTFNGTGSIFLSLHIGEWNNTALSQTLDTHTNGQSSTGTTHTDATMTVTGNDLIFSSYIANAGNTSVGAGFSPIAINDANWLNSEYELNVTSNIAAVFTNSSSASGGIMSAAFKAGTVTGGSIIATTPSGAVTVVDPIPQFMTSGNYVRFQYEKLDRDDQSYGFLAPYVVQGGTINYDYLSSIKRTATFKMLDVTPDIFDFVNDRIRPWMGVQMPDYSWVDYPLGVFLCSTPTRHAENGLITRDIQGYDKSQILVDKVLTNISTYGGYYLPAGTEYTDAIRALLNQAGIPDSRINMVDSEATLPVDRTWKKATAQQKKDDPKGVAESSFRAHNKLWTQGSNTLQILNDLMTAINYGSLYWDGMGACYIQPYQDPDKSVIDHSYSTNSQQIIQPVVDQTLDLFAVPNTIVFAVSQPDRPVLTSKFVNSDPSSIVSTVNRGRKVIRFDSSFDVATQAQLDQLVKQAAIDAANVYEHIVFNTLPMPNHGDRDTIMLTHNVLGISDVYQEMKWSMELKPGGTMMHDVRRVVNIDQSLLGDPDFGS